MRVNKIMDQEYKTTDFEKCEDITRITKENLKLLAEDIVKNPKEWILFLGENITICIQSVKNCEMENKKQLIIQMVQDAIENNKLSSYDTERMYEAVQNQDYKLIKSLLFGNVWDGALFVDNYRKLQLERRECYAKNLPSIERMNVEFAKCNVNQSLKDNSLSLIKILNDIILTTCQDETVEALLEYEKAMPIDGLNVCTPYSMLTSPKWQRRLNSYLGINILPVAEDNNSPILVKLYGSSDNPKRMLLSDWDFAAHYPLNYEPQDDINNLKYSWEEKKPYTMLFLETIFRNKNLLFIGVDELKDNKVEGKCRINVPEGIRSLLEKTSCCNKSRFALTETNPYCFLKLLRGLENEIRLLSDPVSTGGNKETENKNVTLDIKSAEQYFWELYTRRPKKNIAVSEQEVFKKYVLEKGKDSWTKIGIETLSIIANKSADFYDLKEMLDEEWNAGTVDNFDSIPIAIIKKSLDCCSAILFRVLLIYGNGFPSSFLNLCSCNSDQEKDIKRSAIRLVNKGICSKGQQRKNIHKRMKYADNIMLTAGNNKIPNRNTFRSELEEVDRQVNDSYFFLAEIFNKNNSNLWEEYNLKAIEKLGIMCDSLMRILEQKSNRYNHYRSLLETEFSSLLEIVPKLNKDSVWKSDFVYCLFQESRLVKEEIKESGNVMLLLEELKNQLDCDLQNNIISEQEFYRSKVKNLICQGIVRSQSSNDEFQIKAIEKCNKALKELEKLCTSVNTSQVFILKINIYFLYAKIYGRRATIEELSRCEQKMNECPKQQELLLQMKKSLDTIKDLISTYNDCNPCSYNEIKARLDYLYGEYFFKDSQYYKENRQYSSSDSECERIKMDESYEKSIQYYESAIKFYNRYPDLYSLEIADVHRSIGDCYCQQGKGSSNAGEETVMDIPSKCFENLYDAFKIYRLNTNLRGIADVLQSMGNTESYKEFKVDVEKNKRSSFCFYNASKELYDFLGDEWSFNVVEKFSEGAKKEREFAFSQSGLLN